MDLLARAQRLAVGLIGAVQAARLAVLQEHQDWSSEPGPMTLKSSLESGDECRALDVRRCHAVAEPPRAVGTIGTYVLQERCWPWT